MILTQNFLIPWLRQFSLDYGSPVWGNKCPTQLINVQKHAMRYFLGCSKTMPLAATTGEMGWVPLHYRLNLNMLKY